MLAQKFFFHPWSLPNNFCNSQRIGKNNQFFYELFWCMYVTISSIIYKYESGDFALAKSPLSPNPMLKEGLAHHKEWISDHQFKDLLSLVWYNVGCSCQLVFYSVHLKHLPAFTRLAFYNIYGLYRLTDEPTD